MEKKEIIIGFVLGLIVALIGTLLFLVFFTGFNSINDLQIIKQQGSLGKVITLGAILNLFVFFFLLQKKKDVMARGVVLAMIFLTIITLLV